MIRRVGAVIYVGALLFGQANSAEAEPKRFTPREQLDDTRLIGGSAFLGVSQVSDKSAKAQTTISFVSSGTAKTPACFKMVSRDGRYRATAVFGNDDFKEKGVHAFSFTSAYPIVFKEMSDRDMAVEIRFSADCAAAGSADVRAISWFGKSRPTGPRLLSFQSLRQDAYFVPQGAASKPMTCQKFGSGVNIAFDAFCAFPAQSGEIRGEIRIFDIDAKLSEMIPVVLDEK